MVAMPVKVIKKMRMVNASTSVNQHQQSKGPWHVHQFVMMDQRSQTREARLKVY